jgi:hypothetical protein
MILGSSSELTRQTFCMYIARIAQLSYYDDEIKSMNEHNIELRKHWHTIVLDHVGKCHLNISIYNIVLLYYSTHKRDSALRRRSSNICNM